MADVNGRPSPSSSNGTETQMIAGITDLQDALAAGGKDSDKCTLILTEGDSAKALAMAGLSVVGCEYYGVFALRGRLPSVKEASDEEIMKNCDIQKIQQMLGLEWGKVYHNVESLRYGQLMMMADRDFKGSLFKSLLINFLYKFWPSLLKVPSFLVNFITPIFQARYKENNQVVLSFYSGPEYVSWLESVRDKVNSDWDIKYCEYLESSTFEDGIEYFKNIKRNTRKLIFGDDKDGDAILLGMEVMELWEAFNMLYKDEEDAIGHGAIEATELWEAAFDRLILKGGGTRSL